MKRTGFLGWVLDRVAPALFKAGRSIEQVFASIQPSLTGLTRTYLGGWFASWKKEDTYRGEDFTAPVYSTFPIWAMNESERALKRRYLLTFKAEIIDKDTGERKTVYWQSYSMKLESQAGWTNRFASIYAKKQDRYKAEILSFTLDSVTHSKGFTY